MNKSFVLSDVYICIPTKGSIRIELTHLLMEWVKMGATISSESSPLIDNARNIAVRNFLKTDKKYLLFIDADIIPGIDFPQLMLKDDKDVLGAYHYMILSMDSDGLKIAPAGFIDYAEDQPDKTKKDIIAPNPRTGIVKVKAWSTGMMMIKREVLEKIGKKWFYFEWSEDYESFIGEDYTFCKLVYENGFEVWADTNLVVKHMKTVAV